MRFISFACVFPLLAALAAAYPPPSYEGFQLKWFDDFAGPAGSFPDEKKWRGAFAGTAVPSS